MAAQATTDNHVYETPEITDPEKEPTTKEETECAEVPSSNKEASSSEQGSMKKEVAVDPEKGETRDAYSNSSDDGLPDDQDLEKVTPVISKEPEPPSGPNVVDWDGPDDPQNPYNW